MTRRRPKLRPPKARPVAMVQTNFRTTPTSLKAYQTAARRCNMLFTTWIRTSLDNAAAAILALPQTTRHAIYAADRPKPVTITEADLPQETDPCPGKTHAAIASATPATAAAKDQYCAPEAGQTGPIASSPSRGKNSFGPSVKPQSTLCGPSPRRVRPAPDSLFRE